MALNIQNINTKIVHVEGDNKGKATQSFFRSLSDLFKFANDSPLTFDFAGTPEGNVTGKFKDRCWDTVNNVLYFKSTATGNTGWVALN